MTEWRSARYWRNRSPLERVANAHIPKRFMGKTFAEYEHQGGVDIVNLLTGWLTNFETNRESGEGLYLCGPTGTGKTHIAAALLREIVFTKQLGGFFVTSDKYMEAVFDHMNKKDREFDDMYGDPDMIKYIYSVYDILVLDGLGMERQSDYTKKAITTMLNSRYEQKLLTIVTSEYPIDRLDTLYGKRLPSILQECTLSIPFSGKDYRLTSNGKK